VHIDIEASIAPSFFGFTLPSTTLPLLHIQAQPSNISDHVVYYVYLILYPYAGGFICDNLADYITVKTDFVNQTPHYPKNYNRKFVGLYPAERPTNAKCSL
jgi:hypothetical protein